MKKQINAALFSLAAAMALGLAAGFLGAAGALQEKKTPPAEETAAVQTEKVSYILGEQDGRLAVFLPGVTEAQIVFDIYLHHLPEVDRERLRAGIRVADYQTLVTLIEDYTS